HDGQNVEVVGQQVLTKVLETSVREPETDTDRQKIGSIATEISTGELGCKDKEATGFQGLDGILADLGVSSHQFDTAERGFSFRYDAPLDMRMNTKAELTAADVVNDYETEDLERIFRLYGEVENARKLSQLIVKNRAISRIETTSQLDKAIEEATPKFAEHKYLAKVYQALRIEVNQEMRSLEKFLEGCAKSLKSGGKLVVITYHSLEDRMVKNFIKSGRIDGVLEKDVFGQSKEPFEAVNRKPILPSEEEISENTRARSAKLRIAVKK
ncbi:MAG: 16S rRNA (cytosine(1402)-N(4))-methyltransferase RsmH, partial [Candidatus Cryptobacteroides sp.]